MVSKYIQCTSRVSVCENIQGDVNFGVLFKGYVSIAADQVADIPYITTEVFL